jgi:hypothetical protein
MNSEDLAKIYGVENREVIKSSASLVTPKKRGEKRG